MPLSQSRAQADKSWVGDPVLLVSCFETPFDIMHTSHIADFPHEVGELSRYLEIGAVDAWQRPLYLEIHSIGVDTHISATFESLAENLRKIMCKIKRTLWTTNHDLANKDVLPYPSSDETFCWV